MYNLTNSKELSHSWEATSRSDTQGFPNILWNPEVHYYLQNSSTVISILSQMNPDHTMRYSIFLSSILTLSSNLRMGHLCRTYHGHYIQTREGSSAN